MPGSTAACSCHTIKHATVSISEEACTQEAGLTFDLVARLDLVEVLDESVRVVGDVYTSRLALGLHHVGERHVVRPDIELEAPRADDAAQHGARVHAHTHVHLHSSHVSTGGPPGGLATNL